MHNILRLKLNFSAKFWVATFPATLVNDSTLGVAAFTATLASRKQKSESGYWTAASQLVTRSTRHSPKSYDKLTGG